MQDVKVRQPMKPISINKNLLFGALLLLLAGLIFALASGLNPFAANANPEASLPVISNADLLEQYGLRVNLVAVTAAGGMVDVRIKIVDGEKAKSLLQNPDAFPTVWVADEKVALKANADSQQQEIQFENDANLFAIYPNAGGIVKPGTPVSIVLGDVKTEPVISK